MLTKIEAWILDKIAESAPDGIRGPSAVGDLLGARLFLRGKRSHIFGMAGQSSTIVASEELLKACDTAIRAWFDAFAEKDPASQAQLYETVLKLELGIDLPE